MIIRVINVKRTIFNNNTIVVHSKSTRRVRVDSIGPQQIPKSLKQSFHSRIGKIGSILIGIIH